MKTDLTHFDKEGKAIMVDVTAKSPTARQAKARGQIRMNEAAYQAVVTGTAAKGDVLGIARIAGIMAAKRTGDLIPLCHPLAIASCQVEFQFLPDSNHLQFVPLRMMVNILAFFLDNPLPW